MKILLRYIYYNLLFPVCGKNNHIDNRALLFKCRFSIIGNHNRIIIHPGAILHHVEFHIRGNNHIIEIGRDCKILENASLWCEGKENTIHIGDGTSIVSAHICAQETGNSIVIGEDCMLSNHILIRTSDSHPFYDSESHLRLNEAKSVKVDNHVWICAKASILKGANIGRNSIIGYSSIVTTVVSPNSLVVGIPGKVVRQNVYWERRLRQ